MYAFAYISTYLCLCTYIYVFSEITHRGIIFPAVKFQKIQIPVLIYRRVVWFNPALASASYRLYCVNTRYYTVHERHWIECYLNCNNILDFHYSPDSVQHIIFSPFLLFFSSYLQISLWVMASFYLPFVLAHDYSSK